MRRHGDLWRRLEALEKAIRRGGSGSEAIALGVPHDQIDHEFEEFFGEEVKRLMREDSLSRSVAEQVLYDSLIRDLKSLGLR